MMRRLGVVVGISWVVAVAVARAGEPFPPDESLTAGDLPPGFRASVVESKEAGRVIAVTRPGGLTRAVVLTDDRDLSSAPARRAAVKGYVNGLATSLAQQGYTKVVARSIPPLDGETFARPIGIDLTFANAEGKNLFVHEEVSFAGKGFVVQVIADDEDGRKALADWARTVKPRPAPETRAKPGR